MKIASLSGGKDSLTMSDKWFNMFNGFIFSDNGMEFKAIYQIIEDFKKRALSSGKMFITVKPKSDFLYKMFEHKRTRGKRCGECGYGWCGGVCRWGTTDKLSQIDRFCKTSNALDYVGIAADETERLKKERKPHKRFPLAESNMTEADCLKYCYERGYNWLEKTDSIYDVPEYIDLYKILKRVSCWCCRNKNQEELKNIYLYFTNSYWKDLKEMEQRIGEQMKPGKTKKYPQGRWLSDFEEEWRKEFLKEKSDVKIRG